MLEDIAGYLVLAPVVASAGGAVLFVAWSNRRRLFALRVPGRRHRLA